MSTSKNNYPHKNCDESCYYHCTKGGQHSPKCVHSPVWATLQAPIGSLVLSPLSSKKECEDSFEDWINTTNMKNRKSWWGKVCNILNGSCEKNLSKDFLYCRDIIRKYLDDENVKKYFSPVSNDYILQNKKSDINILLEHNKITIANHKFLYKKEFELKLIEKLKEEVKNSIEKQRQQLKAELFKNEIGLLRKIFKDNG